MVLVGFLSPQNRRVLPLRWSLTVQKKVQSEFFLIELEFFFSDARVLVPSTGVLAGHAVH
jgi:hypothetical protein